MEKDILKTLECRYKTIKKIAEKDYSEIEELKKTPEVQRYLYLTGLKNDAYLRESGERLENYIIGGLINEFGYGTIKESNNLWYKYYEGPSKIFKKTNIEKYDDEEIVTIYIDLEDANKKLVISKEEQAEFESTHQVVHNIYKSSDPSDCYNWTRLEFFKSCIGDGQEKAIKRILSRKKYLS